MHSMQEFARHYRQAQEQWSVRDGLNEGFTSGPIRRSASQ